MPKFILILGILGIITIYFAESLQNVKPMSLEFLVPILGIGVLTIIFVIQIFSLRQILLIRKRVSEKQHELLLIAIQLIGFGVIEISLLVIAISPSLFYSYVFRAIKNGCYLLIAWLYWQAFIKPNLMKKVH
jgi:hypothetical protein